MSGLLVGSQLASVAILALVAGCGALIPELLRRKNMSNVLTIGNAFAGGAFVALGLFHTLPTALEDLADADWELKLDKGTFNPAYIFCFLGYVLILLTEVIITPMESDKESRVCETRMSEVEKPTALEVTEGEEENENPKWRADTIEDGPIRRRTSSLTKQLSQQSMGVQEVLKSPSFCLMMAFSMHGFFEGLIVGAEPSVTMVWMTTAVLAGHKWAESFALVTHFYNSNLPRKATLILLGIFISSSPCGVLVGMAIADQGHAAAGVANALSSGTIIYVAGEITQEVFSHKCYQKIKFLFYLCGAAVVLGLTLLEAQVA